MPPKTLLFDLDGTLLDGSANADAIARTCGVIAGRIEGLEAEELRKADAEAFAAVWPTLERDWMLGKVEDPGVNYLVWGSALEACGFNDEALVKETAELHWRLHLESLRLYDDAAELLSRLPAEMPLALITNGASGRQRGALRNVGIEGRFGAVVVSGEVGVGKPDARVFELALEGLGVSAENAWHVGDSLSADIGGANAVGTTSVWINRHREQGVALQGGDPRPDYEIGSLLEVASLLGL